MQKIVTKEIDYLHGQELLKGFLAYPEDAKNIPGVLIVHDWAGLNAVYQERAIEIAKLGYVAFAADMYGMGRVGKNNQEKQALMHAAMQDGQHRERVAISLELLRHLSGVNAQKSAAIGFCFGGLCVLDLARSGASVCGVVSLHGLLHKSMQSSKCINAEILVLHGYDDPMVTPQDVISFCQEMQQAKANFQINMYANTQHAFTNPEADDKEAGIVYQPDAARKAFRAMREFFTDLFV